MTSRNTSGFDRSGQTTPSLSTIQDTNIEPRQPSDQRQMDANAGLRSELRPHPPINRSRDLTRIPKTRTSNKTYQQAPAAPPNDEFIPYSHEVSCASPEQVDYSSVDLATANKNTIEKNDLDFARKGSELDDRIHANIVQGIEYFKRRNDDLLDKNKSLESAILDCRNRLKELETKYDSLQSENEELVAKMEKLEKEKACQEEQHLGEWRTRVKVEEDSTISKGRLEKEIETLKASVARLTDELETSKQRDLAHVGGVEDVSCCHVTIAQLREEVGQLKGEKKRLEEFVLAYSRKKQSQMNDPNEMLSAQQFLPSLEGYHLNGVTRWRHKNEDNWAPIKADACGPRSSSLRLLGTVAADVQTSRQPAAIRFVSEQKHDGRQLRVAGPAVKMGNTYPILPVIGDRVR